MDIGGCHLARTCVGTRAKARPRGTSLLKTVHTGFFQPIKSAAGDKPMLANVLAQQLDALIDQQHRQKGLDRAPPANKTALLRPGHL